MVHSISILGMPAAKEAQFAAKGITTVEEIATFFPRKYYDFRTVTPIAKLAPGNWQCICVKIHSKTAGNPNKILVEDGEGTRMTIAFFGAYPFSRMEAGETWYFAGKFTEYFGRPNLTNPPYASKCREDVNRIIPVYPKIKGMSQEYLNKKIQEALAITAVASGVSDKDLFARKRGLMERADAVKSLHTPMDMKETGAAAKRIAFDEIYDFYEEMRRRKLYRPTPVSLSADSATSRAQVDAFIESIPFPLTSGQKDAVESVIHRIQAGERVDSIISGDVGCGKTMVAMILSVFMAENKLQTAVLAPTLVLAKQHYKEFSSRLSGLGINIALLTGDTKKKEREAILQGVANGTIQILVGTHAILSSDLSFERLGMAIIDEEHKFGVAQKRSLEQYDRSGAHHISMTATPIPRSMAAAIYGDETTVLPIKTMPVGRKPIITTMEQSLDDICDKLRSEVNKGHQAYVVCPYIEDSDESVWSVERATDTLTKKLAMDGITVDCISGNMSSKEITSVVDRFSAGDVDVLVSTTIVEVGVNIPNATIIAILSANRFGLSGLHQLRGRVGRGGEQGYCCLLADLPSAKLGILCDTNDGFRIAEEDMALRGPGDIMGEAQTGDNHTIQLILQLPKMAAAIRKHLSNT